MHPRPAPTLQRKTEAPWRPVAVILSPDDLAQLEETLSVLSDPQALADIREADAAYAAGEVIRGTDAARALRA